MSFFDWERIFISLLADYSPLMPNIEIKSHYPDLAQAHAIATQIGARYLGQDHQIDTYFKVPTGRFKLRESSMSGAILVPYIRDDLSGPKKSSYTLLKASDPALAKELLSQILGVETVVEKKRDIYLVENVRVHLDQVQGLGQFLEFEAVYSEQDDEAHEYEKVRTLIKTFQIPETNLLQGSYRERSLETTTSLDA